MFTSDQWKNNRFASTREGSGNEDVALDKEFWNSIVICLRGPFPIMQVLRMVDSNEKQAIGFIYKAMDQAKETIQKEFTDDKKRYFNNVQIERFYF